MKQFLDKYAYLISVFGGLSLLVSCANMASPTGGAYDLDPPKLVRSNPPMNATQVAPHRIVLEFDENVTVEKPSEMVIITPPQRTMPNIYAVNRKVYVQLKDTLLENTTYTVDFTDAIADNNEKNVLESFSLSFSTGDHLDTLAISGTILQADNLEPVKGMYVGLHSNLEDSAFTKLKFERISRTNDRGRFTVRGVAPGKYKVYGLDDANRDYTYDNPSEAVAFLDEIIVPSSERAFRTDTVFNTKDPLRVDTVNTVEYTRFLPDDIVLRSFTSAFKRQYLQKYEREKDKLHIFFGAPTAMPEVEPMSFDKSLDWSVLEKSRNNDTLTYWIKDKNLAAMDTLSFQINYQRTDSLNQIYTYTDTLNFIDRSRKPEKEKKKKKDDEEEEEKIVFLNIKNNLNATWDIYNNISLEFDQPLADSLMKKIRLQSIVDSTFNDLDFQLDADSLNPRKFTLKHKWQYGKEYQVSIDSAAIHSIYGLWNNKLEQKFKVKTEEQYGKWAYLISGLNDSVPAFVELLDKGDKPVRKVRVVNNAAVFRNLNPGQYYARIVIDENGNGVWDTGDYYTKRQPEMVCYRDKPFDIKANYELTEEWFVDTSNLIKQKPLDITKNKPVEKDSKRKQLEKEEEKKRGQKNQNQNQDGTYNSRNNQTNSQYNSNMESY